MVTRVSLVKLRHGLAREDVLQQWLGAHADVVRGLPQVRDYVVSLAAGPRPAGAWDALATLRFDTAEDLRALEAPPTVATLARTREGFIATVDVFLVDEHVVVRDGRPV